MPYLLSENLDGVDRCSRGGPAFTSSKVTDFSTMMVSDTQVNRPLSGPAGDQTEHLFGLLSICTSKVLIDAPQTW